MWFRRDLRVDDHAALASAAARGEVVALWVADPALLNAPHHRSPMRLRFLRACLEALDAQLRDLGIGLVVREGDPAVVVPAVASEAGADLVVVTDDVTPYARRRDAAVRDALATQGVAFDPVGGPWRVPLGDLEGSSGNGYLVFTPFFKAWDQVPVAGRIAPPELLTGPALPSDGLGCLPAGDPPIAAGPAAARARLEEFIRSGHADGYGEGRDDLAADATSHLSADLLFGTGLRKDGATPNGDSVPAYTTVNFGISREFSALGWSGLTARFDILNAFDEIYTIRDGTGVGVGAPQFGARRGFFFGLSKAI